MLKATTKKQAKKNPTEYYPWKRPKEKYAIPSSYFTNEKIRWVIYEFNSYIFRFMVTFYSWYMVFIAIYIVDIKFYLE